jgi:hypothetical protein
LIQRIAEFRIEISFILHLALAGMSLSSDISGNLLSTIFLRLFFLYLIMSLRVFFSWKSRSFPWISFIELGIASRYLILPVNGFIDFGGDYSNMNFFFLFGLSAEPVYFRLITGSCIC